jgi:transposase InsO family protein
MKEDAMGLDNGTEFKGEFGKVMAEYFVQVRNTAPYHPQTNGKIERLWGILRKLLRKRGELTSAMVDEVVEYYNTARVHRALRRIGFENHTPLDVWRQEELHWQYHLDNLGCEHWTERKWTRTTRAAEEKEDDD